VHALIPLAAVVPILVAALLAAGNAVIPRWCADALAIGCALAVTAICALLTAHVGRGADVYWFGGFHPHGHIAVGISFAPDRLGAGMATLAAALVSAALIYCTRYFDEMGSLFGTLMLVFLAAMVGFCLTGDLFNLFVFFELMSVAAYALTAYKLEETGPLQGAINFAITNSVGSFAMLTGIALLYGRTGALNMAQIGSQLAAHPADGLVRVALLLVLGGLLVKAAIVPLHFWLADAHAVAPTPVCVLFSGAMVELGLFGVARVYWSVFSGPMAAHAAGLRVAFVALGTLTALVGAAMCLSQRHLKRLLAFSTISHTGMFLVGLGLLMPAGLAASGQYVLEHAFLKGSLFMAVGVLLHRFCSVDEHELRGRGRAGGLGVRVTGVVFAAAALGLAALPPLGVFFGKSALESALKDTPGYAWAIAAMVLSSALATGSILRAGARVFFGWGASVPRHHELLSATSEKPETLRAHDRTPAVMVAPMLALALAGLAVGLVSPIRAGISAAAAQMTERAAYAAHVLGGRAGAPASVPHPSLQALDFALAALTVLGALAVAAWSLSEPAARRRRLARARLGLLASLGARVERRTTGAAIALRRLHSGCVTDYVAWLTAGLAVIGGALALV
jgi:multicomponent Na+:H+ antiporter subunit D